MARDQFPKLRNERIVCSDFFNEATWGIRTDRDSHSYDLIVGNPAWGARTASDAAFSWSKANGWPIERKNIGPLFLPKCAALTKPQGMVKEAQSGKITLYSPPSASADFSEGQFSAKEWDDICPFSASKHLETVCSLWEKREQQVLAVANAIKEGDVVDLRKLKSEGVDLNMKWGERFGNWTPLWVACRLGKIEVV